MNSTIATKVVAAVQPICPIYADEAETMSAPYAVYTINETPVYDMDGLCAWSADVQIALCATSFDAADDLADAAIDALEAIRDQVGIRLDGRQPYESSEAKLYVIILSYTIRETV